MKLMLKGVDEIVNIVVVHSCEASTCEMVTRKMEVQSSPLCTP